MKYILLNNSIIATHEDSQEIDPKTYNENAILVQGDYDFPKDENGLYLPLTPEILLEINNDMIEKQKLELQKSFIKTSLGYLRIKTKVGDLLSIFSTYAAIVLIQGFFPENSLLIYNEDGSSFWNSQMTASDFYKLFNEVIEKYQKLFNGD